MKKNKKQLRLEDALVPIEEQPYEVPENWCWTKVKYVSEVVTGSTPSKKHEQYYGGSFPFFKPADLDSGDNVMDATEYLSDEGKAVSRIIPRLSTAVCCIGTIGKSGLLKIEGTTNQQINSMIPKINPLYVYYYSKTDEFVRELWNKSTSTTISMVNKSNMETNNIPLPPLPEQQRIVERIESLFSKLDEAKEKAQEAVHSFDNRKTMIIHNAFQGTYTEKWRKDNNIDIGTWQNLTLNDVAEYKKGPFGSSITKAMFVPKGKDTFKVYEQGNAIRKTIEYGHYYIPKEKYNELKGFSVQSGDIIISCAGTIGEVYKLPKGCEQGVINQALMRVRIFDIIDEGFFVYYFGEVLKGDVNEQANGTAIKNIPPFKIMKAMEIKLPDLSEQKEIVRFLDTLLAKEEHAKKVAEILIDKIDLMKKSILAKAFRGELGTNNPDEESSVGLLNNILDDENK